MVAILFFVKDQLTRILLNFAVLAAYGLVQFGWIRATDRRTAISLKGNLILFTVLCYFQLVFSTDTNPIVRNSFGWCFVLLSLCKAAVWYGVTALTPIVSAL